jgi:hypothetical protein
MNSAEAAARGRLGAHTRWAREPDRAAATEAARRGLMSKFEREVDPDGSLSPQERAFRAAHAQQAHMERMSLAAARARRLKATG